ncbi:MAG: hypothetical protein ACON3Z_05970 [Bradymonadia bacterium]
MLKKGMFAILAMVGCLGGCGEVTELALSIRPSQAEFPAVKAALIEVGCSRPGCHLTLTGDFKLDPDDNSAANLDEEYQLAKGFVDLDDPDASILVRVGLKGDPAAESHRFLCFENADACAYRKVDAWLRAAEPGDPSIGDIDCEPIKDACNTI